MSWLEDDGYFCERPTIEDPSLSKDDYAEAARINKRLLWNGATCEACGIHLNDTTTACPDCDRCHDCAPGDRCFVCRDLRAEDAADRARRAAQEMDA